MQQVSVGCLMTQRPHFGLAFWVRSFFYIQINFKAYYLYSIDVLPDSISYFIIVGKDNFLLSLP